MHKGNSRSGFLRASICCATVLALSATGALAQQKQKVSYKVGAEGSKYTQRHVLDVGDNAGHQVTIFEIHRAFGADGPVINGVKVKESWTRGYGDYEGNNGLSTNYGVFVMENGDRFFTKNGTMGQADASGKRSTITVGQVLGGTGKLAGMKGLIRSKGVSDGKAGLNETQSEIEYRFGN
jgi:hypothetical protein